MPSVGEAMLQAAREVDAHVPASKEEQGTVAYFAMAEHDGQKRCAIELCLCLDAGRFKQSLCKVQQGDGRLDDWSRGRSVARKVHDHGHGQHIGVKEEALGY